MQAEVLPPVQKSFEAAFSDAERALRSAADGLKAAAKSVAAGSKASRIGDVQALSRAIQAARANLRELEPALDAAAASLTVDYAEGLRSGDFAREVEALAAKSGLAGVRVVYGVLFSFPVTVTPLPEKRGVRIGRKALRVLRPSELVARLEALRKKKSSPARLSKLIDAVERAYLAASGERVSVAVKIADVHDRLTPLPEQKTDYSITDFVADLYALERAQILETAAERKLSFPASTSTRGGNAIRITSEEGEERLYSSIRFD